LGQLDTMLNIMVWPYDDDGDYDNYGNVGVEEEEDNSKPTTAMAMMATVAATVAMTAAMTAAMTITTTATRTTKWQR
jgi:hypothetical protein